MVMAVTKAHQIKSNLNAAINYILNPGKTSGKLLVSASGCGSWQSQRDFSTSCGNGIRSLCFIPHARPMRVSFPAPSAAMKHIVSYMHVCPAALLRP